MATATVQVELNDSTGSNQADATRNQQRVANEARMYRSQALAEQVVRDLSLNRNQAFTHGVQMTVQQLREAFAYAKTITKPGIYYTGTVFLCNQTRGTTTIDRYPYRYD